MINTKTLNIALPKDLLTQVDLAAKKEYRNRSELIREALRVYLKDQQEWGKIFAYGRQQARKIGVKKSADVDRIVADYRHGR